jgi:hypothetical protein
LYSNTIEIEKCNKFGQKHFLVGGLKTILKNMKVNGKDDIPYMKWKIENV